MAVVFARMEAAVQQVCSSCGNPLLPDGDFCLFCGDVLADRVHHPPANKTTTPVEVPPRHASFEYAGFWIRVGAGSVDLALEAVAALFLSVILYFVLVLTTSKSGLSPITLQYLTGVSSILVLTIGAWLYCAFSESSRYSATIGKRIFGLQVLTASGSRLTFGQATVRHFMKFLSLFTATVGFMMVGWTKRSQALHDMPQDCIVIKIAEPSLSIFNKHA